MKRTLITLILISTSTLLFNACNSDGLRGKGDSPELIVDPEIIADCDGIKTSIAAKSAEIYTLKNQTSYCPILIAGLDDVMIWLANLMKAPEKICPNLYDFTSKTDCSGSSCNLGALDDVLTNSMASSIGTLNASVPIVAGIYNIKFTCSPAASDGAKDLFIRIFPKYLLKKTSLFCSNTNEDTLRDAVTGAFDHDVNVTQLPGYTTSTTNCNTTTN